ncbi:MAG: polysaccharide export protein [Hyphomicrobiales bacterium]|nr:polysaccharide export protein [Hyphomicrobiales bacterium]
MRVLGKWAVLSLSLAAAGCSYLPSQGPTASEVVSGGAAQTADAAPRYLVDNLDARTVAILKHEPNQTLSGRFGTRGGAASPTIGLGDSVSVTVWEAASGGLFSSAAIGGVTAGSHSAAIPEQAVGRDGNITIPYAGRIHVAGMTPAQVEQAVVHRLEGKAIEPQALVTVTRNVSNTVTVTGEVTNGARVPLSAAGDRVLDVIAAAGGIRAPVPEVFIELSRGGGTAKVPMQALLNHPAENIYVRPRDVLTVVREPQTFTAFGSAGRNALVPFDAVGISLEEAVAKAGGLLDSTADPAGVFLLRAEPAPIARALDPSYPVDPSARYVNVVYKINLKDAATYFLARNFAVRNKDVIYVAAAPTAEFYKAMQLFSALTQPAITGGSIAIAACSSGKC